MALSTTEVDYIAGVEARKEMLWMHEMVSSRVGVETEEYVVFCDSRSAIDLGKNSMYHSHTKHIGVRYHWLRFVTKEKLMVLNKIHIDKNVADMLTKVIPSGKFDFCIR